MSLPDAQACQHRNDEYGADHNHRHRDPHRNTHSGAIAAAVIVGDPCPRAAVATSATGKHTEVGIVGERQQEVLELNVDVGCRCVQVIVVSHR